MSLIVKHFLYVVISAGSTGHSNPLVSDQNFHFCQQVQVICLNRSGMKWHGCRLGVRTQKRRKKDPYKYTYPDLKEKSHNIFAISFAGIRVENQYVDRGRCSEQHQGRGQTALWRQQVWNACAGALFLCVESCSGLPDAAWCHTLSKRRVCTGYQSWLLSWPQLWVRWHLNSPA